MMMKRMRWENEVEAQSSFCRCVVILVPAIDCTYCEKHLCHWVIFEVTRARKSPEGYL